MRKLCMFAVSCIALVAFIGLSAPAFASVVDPDCDLDNSEWGDGTPGPYNNDPAVREFSIVTPEDDSNVAGEVSGLTATALVCGTVIGQFPEGQETIYDHANISMPPGMDVNGTVGMGTGRFVGVARANIAGYFFYGDIGIPVIFGVGVWDLDDEPEGISSVLTTASIEECVAEEPVGGDIDGDVIACYKSEVPVSGGHSYIWVTRDEEERNRLTTGPPSTGVAGPTRTYELSLCGYAGAPPDEDPTFPDDCGDGSDPDTWLLKNGYASALGCSDGAGLYTITYTMIDGPVEPEESTCVEWEPVDTGPAPPPAPSPPAPPPPVNKPPTGAGVPETPPTVTAKATLSGVSLRVRCLKKVKRKAKGKRKVVKRLVKCKRKSKLKPKLVVGFRSSAAAKVKVKVAQRIKKARGKGRKRRTVTRTVLRRTLKAKQGKNRYVLPIKRRYTKGRLTGRVSVVGTKGAKRVRVRR